ncbi:MAG: response regulator transcription factor [Elusimicrobiota bacterium]
MTPASAKKKVLVVEDEEEYRLLFSGVLSAAGYAVFLAPNGEEGLRLYGEQSPDLVILDVMLPDVLGFEFCRRVRGGKVRPQTPILFCTVRSAVSQLARGVKSGGTDYMLKPFSPEELLTRVRAALDPASQA